MKVKLTKPIRVNAEGGEVEVSEQEAERLFVLGAAEVVTENKEEKKKKK